MTKFNRVLVTGGAGYIGSHTVLELLQAGYQVVVVDNFVNAVSDANGLATSLKRVERLTGKSVEFYSVDITDEKQLRDLFKKCQFDCVIHLAALKSVGESVAKPLDYYSNNLIGTLTLIRVMKEAGVKQFVFSSSATVYGDPQALPITEGHPTGQGLTNPYGQTKYMMEQMLMDLCKAESEWGVVLLRYFNPVGAHPSGDIGEDPAGVPNNLMPYVAQVAVGRLPQVRVYGNDYSTPDGTGVRDYIHIVDLAKGHVAALAKLERGGVSCVVRAVAPVAAPSALLFQAYNLGTGRGYSVLEMIAGLSAASGNKIPYAIEGRRPGDLASVYCDPKLAQSELEWKADLGIEDMCRDLWNWQSKNPNGFRADPKS